MRVLFWLTLVLPVVAAGLLVAGVDDVSPPDAVAEVDVADLGGAVPPLLEEQPIVPCDDGDPWTLDQVKHYPDQCVHEDLCVSYDGALIVQRGVSTCQSGSGALAVASNASNASSCADVFPTQRAECENVAAIASGASSARVCGINDGLSGLVIRCSDVLVGASNASLVAGCNSRFGGSCDDILAIAQNGSQASVCGGSGVGCENVSVLSTNASSARACIGHGCTDVSAVAVNGSTSQACDTFRSIGYCSDVSVAAANASEAFACDYLCTGVEATAVNGSEARVCDGFSAPACGTSSADARDGSTALACVDGPFSRCLDSRAVASGGSRAVACSTGSDPSGETPCSDASATASGGTEAVANSGETVTTP